MRALRWQTGSCPVHSSGLLPNDERDREEGVPTSERLDALTDTAPSGSLLVVVHSTFPFSHLADALSFVPIERGLPLGKVIRLYRVPVLGGHQQARLS